MTFHFRWLMMTPKIIFLVQSFRRLIFSYYSSFFICHNRRFNENNDWCKLCYGSKQRTRIQLDLSIKFVNSANKIANIWNHHTIREIFFLHFMSLIQFGFNTEIQQIVFFSLENLKCEQCWALIIDIHFFFGVSSRLLILWMCWFIRAAIKKRG